MKKYKEFLLFSAIVQILALNAVVIAVTISLALGKPFPIKWYLIFSTFPCVFLLGAYIYFVLMPLFEKILDK